MMTNKIIKLCSGLSTVRTQKASGNSCDLDLWPWPWTFTRF